MNKLLVVCVALGTMMSVGRTPAAEADGSRPSPQALDAAEDGLLADAADGRLDHISLFDAAVTAGGLPDAEKTAACRTRFEQFRESLAGAIKAEVSVNDRAEVIFRRMHEELLTGRYRAACTELHRTLDDGDYNCVTATVLYRCLCEEFDIPLKTIAETGHVYCLLQGDRPAIIQTTSRDGFAPSDTRSGGREITDVQLLAKIFYNRGVSLLEQDQFQPAYDLLQIAHRLDPQDQIAWRNILACINNWALSECDAGRFQHAVELLLRGLEMAPDYRPFLDNELHVHHRWVSRLCADGRFKQALGILESGHRRRPDAPLFADGRLAVYQAWENARRASGKTDEAIESWSSLPR